MFLLGVLLIAFAARAGALWIWSENLKDDRDVYLALAEGIAAGRGFSVPGSDVPTAYRPPGYPLLLAITGTSGSAGGRGLLHLLLGTGTVWMTYLLGRRLSLDAPHALLAAVLVAIDPLLLRYATFPMTETLVTLLTTALLWAIAAEPNLRRQILMGVLFGFSVLTRPTLWAFGGLLLLRRMAGLWRGVRSGRDRSVRERLVQLPWVTLGVVALSVSPWVVRNWLVLGHPVLMTTHGGYTLLLGNNPAFYREVVEQPWGTVWDGSVGGGQAKWVESLIREMDEAGVAGEVAQDQWMGRRAREHILAEPELFVRACLLRLRRFWSLSPGGADTAAVPSALRVPLAMFYGATFLLAAVGLYRALRVDSSRWLPAILLMAAFTAVHLVYWSNARMRAPVVPVVAVLAARAMTGRFEQRATGNAPD